MNALPPLGLSPLARALTASHYCARRLVTIRTPRGAARLFRRGLIENLNRLRNA